MQLTGAKPLIMGVLNITPDSFSDGGRFVSPDKALIHATQLIQEGADILDIGGESTRPGSLPVDSATEMARVLPVIRAIKEKFPETVLSIDTCKFDVAEAAVEAGVSIINDISAASDIRMAQLCRDKGLTLILMHMQNSPATMQQSPHYPSGVLSEVLGFLKGRVRQCTELGLKKEQVWVDPGIGFGKTVQHNLDLLRRLDKLNGVGSRLVVGTSRKSFLGKLCGDANLPFEERIPGMISSHLYSYILGASVFRVHDVKEMKRSLQMWDAISLGI